MLLRLLTRSSRRALLFSFWNLLLTSTIALKWDRTLMPNPRTWLSWRSTARVFKSSCGVTEPAEELLTLDRASCREHLTVAVLGAGARMICLRQKVCAARHPNAGAMIN